MWAPTFFNASLIESVGKRLPLQLAAMASLVRALDFFADCSLAQSKKVVQVAHLEQYKRSTAVSFSNARCKNFYVVIDGEVSVGHPFYDDAYLQTPHYGHKKATPSSRIPENVLYHILYAEQNIHMDKDSLKLDHPCNRNEPAKFCNLTGVTHKRGAAFGVWCNADRADRIPAASNSDKVSLLCIPRDHVDKVVRPIMISRVLNMKSVQNALKCTPHHRSAEQARLLLLLTQNLCALRNKPYAVQEMAAYYCTYIKKYNGNCIFKAQEVATHGCYFIAAGSVNLIQADSFNGGDVTRGDFESFGDENLFYKDFKKHLYWDDAIVTSSVCHLLFLPGKEFEKLDAMQAQYYNCRHDHAPLVRCL